jgi:hypothetical protein
MDADAAFGHESRAILPNVGGDALTFKVADGLYHGN